MDETKIKTPLVKDAKTLRTYSSDMADAIRENEMSVIKIALAEQARHEREDIYRKNEGSGVKKTMFIIGGIVLILAGVMGVYFLMQKKEADSVVTQTKKEVPALISYDAQTFIDTNSVTNSGDLFTLLKGAVEKQNGPGKLHALFLTHTDAAGSPALVGTQDFLSLLEATAPGSFKRSLSDSYMLGTYQSTPPDTKSHLFLIVQTKDYSQAFAGMLVWEKTILSDLFVPFGIDIAGDRHDLFATPFKDIIINNKDARVLSDKEGRAVLYYLFINKETLVITDNLDTIREITNRFLTKNTKPL